MPVDYKSEIGSLIESYPLPLNTDIIFSGKPPTMASSEFLTNKEQGDWAEEIVFNAINQNCHDYVAIKYGRSDSLAAGDSGFANFYAQYQNELNEIGKKPDVLIFRRNDVPDVDVIDSNDYELVQRAIAAIEVRSSSFLENRYVEYMQNRRDTAIFRCVEIRDLLLSEQYSGILRNRFTNAFQQLNECNNLNIKDVSFRLPSVRNSSESEICELLKEFRENINTLQKRDYLSITPKLEDLVLVNRWIQKFGVKHYYLQVFFDRAYIISFKKILEISSNEENKGILYSVEKDTKNQGKTTIKINLGQSREIINRIDMPEHKSQMKELDRGRLLFYVTFEGGLGQLNVDIFNQEIINDS